MGVAGTASVAGMAAVQITRRAVKRRIFIMVSE
jgi:hypothetical protein